MAKVKIQGISKEIARYLEEYKDEIKEGMENAKYNSSKLIVKELKNTSPEKSGKYKKGWKISKINERYVVHNKVYQLTHLLEFGHAKTNGGRVKAKVHIRPAEEKGIKEYLTEVEKVIKR